MVLPDADAHKLQHYVDSDMITPDVLDRLVEYYYSYKKMRSISAKSNIESFRLLKIIFEEKYPDHII